MARIERRTSSCNFMMRCYRGGDETGMGRQDCLWKRCAILTCYGWEDVDLRHDFYPNDRRQMRFTVAPEVQRELLRRLVELNLKLSGGG